MQGFAFDLIRRIEKDVVSDNVLIDKPPGLEGKNVVMILAPSGS